jgi:DNA polymerase-3 subunit gamma/tau
MNNSNLPLKYRPMRFDELRGQEDIAKFLKNLIKRGQIKRNIIFHGQYGSGKTSAARIYARALVCESPEDGEPCNKCEVCEAFIKGSHIDYFEFDAASKGKIDQIRELLKIANSSSFSTKCKVFLIDECQAISSKAWDAMLKVVEETPKHAVFIFSTTEINKVREAIRSRCHCLEVELLEHKESVEYLQNIAEKENIPHDKGALGLISFLAKGHPRDLLKYLEQANFYGDVKVKDVKQLFNLGYIEKLVGFYRNLFVGNLGESLNCIREWKGEAREKFLRLKEFLLYIQYRFIHHIDIEINPLFNSIPYDVFEGIYVSFSDVIKKNNIKDIKEIDAFSIILKQCENYTIIEDLDLEIWVNIIYSLIHCQSFGRRLDEIKSDQNGRVEETRNRKNRKFLHNTKKAVADKINVMSDEQLLLKNGFVRIN